MAPSTEPIARSANTDPQIAFFQRARTGTRIRETRSHRHSTAMAASLAAVVNSVGEDVSRICVD